MQKNYHLKKDSWHVKMMYYIWKIDYKSFSHMCPYWWLSCFNFLIFIPFLTIKETCRYIIYICKKIFLFFEVLEEQAIERDRKRIEKIVKTKTLEDLASIKNKKEIEKITNLLYYSDWDKYKAFRAVKFALEEQNEKQKEEIENQKQKEYLLKEVKSYYKTLDLKDEIDNINYLKKLKDEKDRILAEKEKQRIIENKKRINEILKVVRPILTWLAYTIGSIIVLFCLYYFVVFVAYLYHLIVSIRLSEKEWENIKFIFKIILSIILFVGTVSYLIIKGHISNFFCWLGSSFDDIEFKGLKVVFKYISTSFKYIAIPFVFIAKIVANICKKIVGFFKFIIQMVKNECPPIIWED